uniref:Uncharacterized protein n=1 Tax=Nelumbo nucifera TaxID=4432 RepID=A0A822ZAZ6_NELNU|nr:TPA_asm: hypothetical protein HUJ06_001674 [Nelumbo nucifera]
MRAIWRHQISNSVTHEKKYQIPSIPGIGFLKETLNNEESRSAFSNKRGSPHHVLLSVIPIKRRQTLEIN